MATRDEVIAYRYRDFEEQQRSFQDRLSTFSSRFLTLKTAGVALALVVPFGIAVWFIASADPKYYPGIAAGISALAATFTALAAVTALRNFRSQTSHQYLTLSAQVMGQMDDTFNSVQMLKARAQAANTLLNNNKGS
jgi:hypothetical protein